MAKNKFKLKVLKDNLKLEQELCRKAIKKAKKEDRYVDCLEYKQSLDTVTWVLSQIECIEKTGRVN